MREGNGMRRAQRNAASATERGLRRRNAAKATECDEATERTSATRLGDRKPKSRVVFNKGQIKKEL